MLGYFPFRRFTHIGVTKDVGASRQRHVGPNGRRPLAAHPDGWGRTDEKDLRRVRALRHTPIELDDGDEAIKPSLGRAK